MEDRTILSLFDYSGNWSQPYRENGYNVIQVDMKIDNTDVRSMEHPGDVHGILAAPPCTHFCSSGARWWEEKGEEAVIEGMALVDAALRFVATCNPTWWCLENPVGRLPDYIGDWKMTFQPHEYAGWADDPESEAYTKRTCLWGDFEEPPKDDVGNQLGSKMAKYGPSDDRSEKRSITPMGFARAFFQANP